MPSLSTFFLPHYPLKLGTSFSKSCLLYRLCHWALAVCGLNCEEDWSEPEFWPLQERSKPQPYTHRSSRSRSSRSRGGEVKSHHCWHRCSPSPQQRQEGEQCRRCRQAAAAAAEVVAAAAAPAFGACNCGGGTCAGAGAGGGGGAGGDGGAMT